MDVALEGMNGNPALAFSGEPFNSRLLSAHLHQGVFTVNPEAAPQLPDTHLGVFALEAIGATPTVTADVTGLPHAAIRKHLEDSHAAFLPANTRTDLLNPCTLAHALAWEKGLFARRVPIPGQFEPGPIARTVIGRLGTGHLAVQIARTLSEVRSEPWTPDMTKEYTRKLLGRLGLGNLASLMTYRSLSEPGSPIKKAIRAKEIQWAGNESLGSGRGFYFSPDGQWLQRITFLGAVIAVDGSQPALRQDNVLTPLTPIELVALGAKITGMEAEDRQRLNGGATSQAYSASLVRKLRPKEFSTTSVNRASDLGILTVIQGIDVPSDISPAAQRLIGLMGSCPSVRYAAQKASLSCYQANHLLEGVKLRYGLSGWGRGNDPLATFAHITGLAEKYSPLAA